MTNPNTITDTKTMIITDSDLITADEALQALTLMNDNETPETPWEREEREMAIFANKLLDEANAGDEFAQFLCRWGKPGALTPKVSLK